MKKRAKVFLKKTKGETQEGPQEKIQEESREESLWEGRREGLEKIQADLEEKKWNKNSRAYTLRTFL